MFVYLSKKIAIPGGLQLRSLSWNSLQGWIACGGDNGLLKVLKLEAQTGKDATQGKGAGAAAAPGSNLSVNQTLEGHQQSVLVVAWNEQYRKLTSSDQTGKITVWMLYKGMWYEEMINNRNKSVVADMRWTNDGQKICICYEDGMVIVGSVEGNRIWGKEVSTVPLKLVQWSPDSHALLFCTGTGELHKFDQMGNFITKIPTQNADGKDGTRSSIVAIDWYDGSEGFVESNCPTLAVAFENGRIQLMTSDSDDKPVLVNTGQVLTCMKWNHNGSTLAVAGTSPSQPGEGENSSTVTFFTPFGQQVRSLRVPGGSVNAISWEGGGLRIALAVDSFIYFANIRPKYNWCYFEKTLVYSFIKADRPEHGVMFWDVKNDEPHLKYVNKLMGIHSYGDRCVLTQKSDDGGPQQWVLIVCNAIGSPIDSKYIDIEPACVAMTGTHVIAANNAYFYAWHYQTEGEGPKRLLQKEARTGRDVARHIDDTEDSGQGLNFKKEVKDPIVAVCARKDTVVIARRSGTAHVFQLPAMRLLIRFPLGVFAQFMSLNCDCSRLALIDIHGLLLVYELLATEAREKTPDAEVKKKELEKIQAGEQPAEAAKGKGKTLKPDTPGKPPATPGTANKQKIVGKVLPFERKDVWDLRWSDDNPELFAVMEKTRMYVFRGLEPEENVVSTGYLCQFKNLKIKAVMLDEALRAPEKPEKDCIFVFETMSLRDTRVMVMNSAISLDDSLSFVNKHSHPRLWRLFAEASLQKLDFPHAEKGFIKCSDYQGISFVKRLKVIDDPSKQKAEVTAYFKDFNSAENIYRDIDRRDLAIEMRMCLGDWFRVVQLLQSGTGGDDTLLARAWNEIGDYYSERHKYAQAVQYYSQAGNLKSLAECYTALEDYNAMRDLVNLLQEGDPLLKVLGERFELVGLAEHAVAAFLKANDLKAAVDCCIHLNDWDRGIDLAEHHNVPQIESLLAQYAEHLLKKKKFINAVQLYRKAGIHTESAKLLFQMAKETKEASRAKQLCILAAHEVELYRKKLLDQEKEKASKGGKDRDMSDAAMAKATLEGLMTDAATTSKDKILEMGWRGAEAYHFLMLAHSQLYSGKIDACMKTSIRLTEYEDILDQREIYTLIALSSYYNKHYKQCSRAFTRLEMLEALTPEQRRAYQDLFEIFTRHPPVDPETKRKYNCPSCDTQIRECNYVSCHLCKHSVYESESHNLKNCALCHNQW
eukprot:m51a1_g13841 hypothetical protein (1211) ;mRNA; r:520608-525261